MAPVTWNRLSPLLLLLLWTRTNRVTSSMPPESVETPMGSDVVLPCSAPTGTDLQDLVLEWTRSDLDHDYMFLFRNGKPFLVGQHPRFRDRVQLQSPDFKNGDLSIVLHDANEKDTGLYECHVVSRSRVKKRSLYNTKPITTIELKVHNPVLEPQMIWALPGDGVVLSMAPMDFPVSAAMWKRADDVERFVFLYGMDHPHHQDPLYEGRVHLKSQNQNQVQDPSLILNNVQPSDNGTYHFHIIQSQRRMKRDTGKSMPDGVVILHVASGAFRLEAGVGSVAAILISACCLIHSAVYY